MKTQKTIDQLINAAVNNSIPRCHPTDLKLWTIDENGDNIPIPYTTCGNCFRQLGDITVRLYILKQELPKDDKDAKSILVIKDSYVPNTSTEYDAKAISLYFKLLEKASDKEILYVQRLKKELETENGIVPFSSGSKYHVKLLTQNTTLVFEEKWIADQWLVMYKEILNNPPRCRPTTFTNSAVEAAVWIFDRNYYWEHTL